MKNKYVFVLIMLLAILVVSIGFTNIYVSHNQQTEDEEFVVVTSFYPMYIATMNVVGDTEGVTLKNLSEPQTGCLHDYQLTPADMKLLSTADVFVVNGGGIESFIEEIAMQYPELAIIEASEGIEFLCEDDSHGHEHVLHEDDEHLHEEEIDADGEYVDEAHNHDVNAHAWMSVELHRKQVENISNALAEIDPKNRESYLANAGVYDGKLEAIQVEQEKVQLLTQGAATIMFHCAFDYVAMDYGLDVAFCMDLDEERQVSAGEVAEVLEVVEHEDVKYIFAEELYGASMCEMVQKEVDVKVIYLDPLNRRDYEMDSYLKGMHRNLELIQSAFAN